MGQSDNVVPIYEATKKHSMIELDERAQRLVRECRSVIENSLPKLSQGMFEKLDDALFQMAEKSENNSKQNEYLSSMREVRKSRQDVQKRFESGVFNEFDSFWRQGPQVKVTNETVSLEGELSLVDEDDLEESLAITSMASRGEGHFGKELFALSQRFAHLAGLQELDEKVLPVAPGLVSERFRDAMQGLPAPIDVKLVMYKLFEKEVVVYLGGVYDELNGVLSSGGVLPKLAHKFKRNPVAPAIKRAREEDFIEESVDESQEAFRDSYQGEENVSDAELFGTLRQLLNRGGLPSQQGQVVSNLPAVETQDLLGALNNIQQTVPSPGSFTPGDVVSLNNIKAELLQAYAIGQGDQAQKSFEKSDEDVIDIIAMLFEFILDDHALPDHMKVLLGRLQIPMLKVAIVDKEFFAKKSHPARRLLNSLAQAAVKLDPTAEKESDPLYGKIETIIQRILDEFEDDPSIFVELYQQFSEFSETEESKSKVVEERATQANKGKEKLEGARSQVDTEIDQRLQALQDVPDVVLTLFRGPWKDVMSLTLLRHGAESEEWENTLATMDRVLWSVQPKSAPHERKKLLTEIPLILKELRENLVAISYDQRHTSKIFKALQAAHIACLRNENPKSTGQCVLEDESSFLMDAGPATQWPEKETLSGTVDVESILQVDGEQAPEPIADPEPPQEETQFEIIDDEHQQRAEGIEAGTWFEFRSKDALPLRLKLSWRSSMTDLCVFVNRKGMKVREMRIPEIAQGMREFKICVVEEAGAPQLMDRAMKAMVDALQSSKDVLSDNQID